MTRKKKVLIVGNNHELNAVSERIFRLGGFETIICHDEYEARKLHRSEGDTIECVFYPKKHKKKD
ncbi:hypothetical protein LCGC14_1827580 [marine sediment metagenome]|uniref:Uncharacterized protein n=1 Tax=marine sediment metagenome TaxID=412755 RepID=A0A0F9IWL0_9ZZZZ